MSTDRPADRCPKLTMWMLVASNLQLKTRKLHHRTACNAACADEEGPPPKAN